MTVRSMTAHDPRPEADGGEHGVEHTESAGSLEEGRLTAIQRRGLAHQVRELFGAPSDHDLLGNWRLPIHRRRSSGTPTEGAERVIAPVAPGQTVLQARHSPVVRKTARSPLECPPDAIVAKPPLCDGLTGAISLASIRLTGPGREQEDAPTPGSQGLAARDTANRQPSRRTARSPRNFDVHDRTATNPNMDGSAPRQRLETT